MFQNKHGNFDSFDFSSEEKRGLFILCEYKIFVARLSIIQTILNK